MKETIENMIDYIAGADFFGSIGQILLQGPADYPQAWAFVKSIFQNVALPLGFVLFLIYFLVALVDKSTTETLNIEQIFKMFLKLIVALYLVQNSLNIVETLMDWGTLMVNKVSSAGLSAGTMGGVADDLKALAAEETGDYHSLLKCLGFIINLILPWAITWIINIIIKVQCYVRLFEMMIMACGAPIATADIFLEGTSGGAIRYLKRMLAVALQGGIMLMIAMLFSSIAGAGIMSGAGFSEYVGSYLVFGVAACLLIGKSNQIARDWVGVS